MQSPRCHGPQMRATQVTQTVASEIGPQFLLPQPACPQLGGPFARCRYEPRAMTSWVVAAISRGPEAM